MPRRLLGIYMLLLVTVSMVRAQGDAVLFVVGSDTVSRNEFVSNFRRSSEKQLDVFLQSYIRFKQKLQYAKDLGLDTLSGYLQLKAYYHQAGEYRKLVSVEHSPQSMSNREWIKLLHVSCPLNQNASREEERKALLYLDSIYAGWKAGQWNIRQADQITWMQTRYLLKEWQMQLQGLQKNELSKPFYSPVGVHVVAWEDKMVGAPFESVQAEGKGVDGMKEVEEGLLVAALETHLQENIRCTKQDLETYFQKHRTEYGWGTPHFQGAVIHCRDKKEAKRIQKYLKKYPFDMWAEAWKRMPVEVSSHCYLEIDLFAIGSNAFVDKLVFKCGAFESLPDYPFTSVVGEKMKKGPKRYQDVRKQLERNCLIAKKEAVIAALQVKYKAEINQEVLKTVNHAGNK